jgi:hypothetical protein
MDHNQVIKPFEYAELYRRITDCPDEARKQYLFFGLVSELGQSQHY